MDVSTYQKPRGSSPSALAAGLEHALRVVSTTPPGALQILGGTSSCVLRRERNRPQGLYGDGLHRHACVEICFGVEGACRLWTEEGHVPMRAGGLLIIPPNVVHSEGWATPATAYRLLWLAQIGDAVQVFADTYCPGKGWRLEESLAARDSGADCVCESVAELKTGGGGVPSAAHYRLQGGLLTMLANVLRRTAETDPAAERRGSLERVVQIRDYLNLHYAEPITVASVAALFRLSPNYLNNLFSKHEGMGVHAYLLQRRLQAAAVLLQRKESLVKEVCYRVGFNDPLYFCRLYRQRFGHPPSMGPRACSLKRAAGRATLDARLTSGPLAERRRPR